MIYPEAPQNLSASERESWAEALEAAAEICEHGAATLEAEYHALPCFSVVAGADDLASRFQERYRCAGELRALASQIRKGEQ